MKKYVTEKQKRYNVRIAQILWEEPDEDEEETEEEPTENREE